MKTTKRNPRGAGRKPDPNSMRKVGHQLNLWVGPELAPALVKAAQARGISLAELVRRVLGAWILKHGPEGAS